MEHILWTGEEGVRQFEHLQQNTFQRTTTATRRTARFSPQESTPAGSGSGLIENIENTDSRWYSQQLLDAYNDYFDGIGFSRETTNDSFGWVTETNADQTTEYLRESEQKLKLTKDFLKGERKLLDVIENKYTIKDIIPDYDKVVKELKIKLKKEAEERKLKGAIKGNPSSKRVLKELSDEEKVEASKRETNVPWITEPTKISDTVMAAGMATMATQNLNNAPTSRNEQLKQQWINFQQRNART